MHFLRQRSVDEAGHIGAVAGAPAARIGNPGVDPSLLLFGIGRIVAEKRPHLQRVIRADNQTVPAEIGHEDLRPPTPARQHFNDGHARLDAEELQRLLGVAVLIARLFLRRLTGERAVEPVGARHRIDDGFLRIRRFSRLRLRRCGRFVRLSRAGRERDDSGGEIEHLSHGLAPRFRGCSSPARRLQPAVPPSASPSRSLPSSSWRRRRASWCWGGKRARSRRRHSPRPWSA